MLHAKANFSVGIRELAKTQILAARQRNKFTSNVKQMKILYLYSELAGYQIPIFTEYTTRYGAEVHVVSWDKDRLKPYDPPEINGVTYYKRSEYIKGSLLKLANDINPDIVYISGWVDKSYLAVVRKLRKSGVPIIIGFDDQYKGTLRQRGASIVFPFVRKKFYSYAWVAGPYQYEFARRLGFKNHEIIFNLLSCNSQLFNKGKEYLRSKASSYPNSFLYVGNFRPIKGTDILLEAFKKYRSEYDGDWKLICVGNGEMRSLLEDVPNVEVIDFASQEKLLEITKKAGAFVLPSRAEQWGVVVHEFVSAAMPLILSENVGAKPVFFIENYNGISYKNNSADNLAKAMNSISIKSDLELIQMSNNSFKLSQSITPQLSAASFLSILSDTDVKDESE